MGSICFLLPMVARAFTAPFAIMLSFKHVFAEKFAILLQTAKAPEYL
jgi:hypothetical protein